jgi:hypothetical protein
LLVWAARENNYNSTYGGWSPGILTVTTMSFGRLWPQPMQNGGGRLLAFDVSSSTAPTLLSDLDLATNGGWNFSNPFATDGLVYLSHQSFVELETTNTVSDTNVVIFNWWQPRFQRSYLDVVDYTDARQPTVRPPEHSRHVARHFAPRRVASTP